MSLFKRKIEITKESCKFAIESGNEVQALKKKNLLKIRRQIRGIVITCFEVSCVLSLQLFSVCCMCVCLINLMLLVENKILNYEIIYASY